MTNTILQREIRKTLAYSLIAPQKPAKSLIKGETAHLDLISSYLKKLDFYSQHIEEIIEAIHPKLANEPKNMILPNVLNELRDLHTKVTKEKTKAMKCACSDDIQRSIERLSNALDNLSETIKDIELIFITPSKGKTKLSTLLGKFKNF
ncbi:MAG TPA: hypothetical protein VF868_10580 [Bacteroidia bacterium]|jgi:DNA primase catalytic subunit